jgi:hypothetical protein
MLAAGLGAAVVGSAVSGSGGLPSEASAAPAQVPCTPIGGGKYECSWWRPGNGISGGAIVVANGRRVGYLHQGRNWILCQQRGATVTNSTGAKNNWYGWTVADNGARGWASALDARGGDDFGGFSGVPNCNGKHGPAPSVSGIWETSPPGGSSGDSSSGAGPELPREVGGEVPQNVPQVIALRKRQVFNFPALRRSRDCFETLRRNNIRLKRGIYVLTAYFNRVGTFETDPASITVTVRKSGRFDLKACMWYSHDLPDPEDRAYRMYAAIRRRGTKQKFETGSCEGRRACNMLNRSFRRGTSLMYEWGATLRWKDHLPPKGITTPSG